MRKFSIKITPEAISDVDDVFDFITDVCKSPLTARKLRDGLYNEIIFLQHSAATYNISTNKSILRFGYNARKVIFKNMTIIYTIQNNIVYIRRVIPSGLIIGI
jgi:hypothetical protein